MKFQSAPWRSIHGKAIVAILAIALAGGGVVVRAQAQEMAPENTTHSSVSIEKDAASLVGRHRYNSDAERARDALLITEVKSALAEDEISQDYPVEVDCDHGAVTLSGVVASSEDVTAAAEDAADVNSVVSVKNLLRPH